MRGGRPSARPNSRQPAEHQIGQQERCEVVDREGQSRIPSRDARSRGSIKPGIVDQHDRARRGATSPLSAKPAHGRRGWRNRRARSRHACVAGPDPERRGPNRSSSRCRARSVRAGSRPAMITRKPARARPTPVWSPIPSACAGDQRDRRGTRFPCYAAGDMAKRAVTSPRLKSVARPWLCTPRRPRSRRGTRSAPWPRPVSRLPSVTSRRRRSGPALCRFGSGSARRRSTPASPLNSLIGCMPSSALAVCHRLADGRRRFLAGLAGDEFVLWLELIGDAEPLNTLAMWMPLVPPARRVGIGDGIRREQGLLELLVRADIGLRRAFLDRERDRRTADHEDAAP